MRKITEDWSVDIDDSFQRRIEDESLVFWKPGQSVWINCWGDGTHPSKAEALANVREDADPQRRQVLDEEDGDIYRFIYALTEQQDNKVRYAAYSFAVIEGQYLQMAIYFDSLDDRAWALSVARSPIFRDTAK